MSGPYINSKMFYQLARLAKLLLLYTFESDVTRLR